MDNRTHCPICRTPGAQQATAGANTLAFHCPRCGKFEIQTFAETKLRNACPAFPPMHLLSGLCRNTWEMLGEKALVTVDMFQSWAEFDKGAKIVIPRDTDLRLKGDYLLKFMHRKVKGFAEECAFTPNELSTAFCANKAELVFCLRYLEAAGWIEEVTARKGQANGAMTYRFTPGGWARLDSPTPPHTLTAAVICPAGENDTLWAKGFSAAVQETGYKAICLDNRAVSAKICDERIVAVRQADALVVDLSEPSSAGLFEAGLAFGLGKPVYWTCREDAVNEKRIGIDTRQFILTRWSPEHLSDFALRLSRRILALGQAPSRTKNALASF